MFTNSNCLKVVGETPNRLIFPLNLFKVCKRFLEVTLAQEFRVERICFNYVNTFSDIKSLLEKRGPDLLFLQFFHREDAHELLKIAVNNCCNLKHLFITGDLDSATLKELSSGANFPDLEELEFDDCWTFDNESMSLLLQNRYKIAKSSPHQKK